MPLSLRSTCTRLVVLLLLALLLPPAPAVAATVQIRTQAPTLAFPEELTLAARITPTDQIARVVIEYRVDQRTCGTVIARAFPKPDPAQPDTYRWTWEMRQSGSMPPGATIRYRWIVTLRDGTTVRSDQQTVLWRDEIHSWQSRTRGTLTVWWYSGDTAFADALLTAGTTTLTELEALTGTKSTTPIQMLIYPDTDALRAAILYEPSWIGGQAHTEKYIVIMGIAPADREWGARVTAHELAHVVIGDLTFSCIVTIPTWLNEGLAVYAEGGLDESGAADLRRAITTNRLLPVRALSGAFSADPGRADLSYSQSYSLVEYLIRTGGNAKIQQLLAALRDGVPIEPAMQRIYGFGIDAFDDRWRAAIGAPPRPKTTP